MAAKLNLSKRSLFANPVTYNYIVVTHTMQATVRQSIISIIIIFRRIINFLAKQISLVIMTMLYSTWYNNYNLSDDLSLDAYNYKPISILFYLCKNWNNIMATYHLYDKQKPLALQRWNVVQCCQLVQLVPLEVWTKCVHLQRWIQSEPHSPTLCHDR